MLRIHITVPAVLLIASALSLAFTPQQARANEHTYDLPGRTDFVEMVCHECHGYQGQGGGNGPRIAPSLMEFETFVNIVRQPYGTMPAYPPGELNEEKLIRIHQYLLSIPQPPDPDSVPALSLE
jgi:mono/diheme cytochrome c family protein